MKESTSIYWKDFKIKHNGINYFEKEDFYELVTYILDKKTNYPVVTIRSDLGGKTMEFHVSTNEKMVKRFNLPFYKHAVNFSYIEGKKYFDQKVKKSIKIPCLSIGTVGVKKVFENILNYWKNQGFYIKYVVIDRETGATRGKECRYYEL